jgi:hypothetical protein
MVAPSLSTSYWYPPVHPRLLLTEIEPSLLRNTGISVWVSESTNAATGPSIVNDVETVQNGVAVKSRYGIQTSCKIR